MSDAPVPEVKKLTADECWQQLGPEGLGRLAVLSADASAKPGDIDIFPVNFTAHDGAVFFRTAPGSKLEDLTANKRVAFESDGVDGTDAWSVVIRGDATRLSADPDIEDAGVLGLKSFHPSDKWNYVRITVDAISGRRFTRAT